MQHTLERLRSEFLEMPGLRLTAAQVQRFCGIDPAVCQAVLDALVQEEFLSVRPDGTYGCRQDEFVMVPAKAWLRNDHLPARAS